MGGERKRRCRGEGRGEEEHQRAPGAVPGEDGGSVQEASQSGGTTKDTTGEVDREGEKLRAGSVTGVDKDERQNKRWEPTGIRNIVGHQGFH